MWKQYPEQKMMGSGSPNVMLELFKILNDSGTPTGPSLNFKASDSTRNRSWGYGLRFDNVHLDKGKTYRMKLSVRNSIGSEDILLGS